MNTPPGSTPPAGSYAEYLASRKAAAPATETAPAPAAPAPAELRSFDQVWSALQGMAKRNPGRVLSNAHGQIRATLLALFGEPADPAKVPVPPAPKMRESKASAMRVPSQGGTTSAGARPVRVGHHPLRRR